MDKVLIGIDIGTTSTKGILYSEDFRPLKQENHSYPLYRDAKGMAEQEPIEIYETVILIIKKLTQYATNQNWQVQTISFSSAMHSLIVLDGNKEPLTRSMTWLDNRSKKWSNWLKSSGKGLEFYFKTGTPTHAMSPLSKLLWLKEVDPQKLNPPNFFVGIKEFILLKLFGEFVCDFSLASGTGLFNITTMTWDPEILALLGINEKQLPKVVSPSSCFTELLPEVRTELALANQIPFIIGASDGCLANLGSGAKENTQGIVTIGTSSALRITTNKPVLDSLGRTFCYVLTEDKWVVGGASNNGGNVLQWAIDLTNKQLTYDEALEKAGKSEVGAGGVTFLPYLNGERAPLWLEEATGSLLGLRSTHQAGDILRAALEGIFFNLAEILTILTELLGKPDELLLSGGLFQSILAQELASDILGLPTLVPESVESSCLGAAYLGAQAVDLAPKSSPQTQPIAVRSNPNNQKKYLKVYRNYQKLNRLLNNY